MVDIQSAAAEIIGEEKKIERRKKKETTGQKYNVSNFIHHIYGSN